VEARGDVTAAIDLPAAGRHSEALNVRKGKHNSRSWVAPTKRKPSESSQQKPI